MVQNVPTFKPFKDYTQEDVKAYRRKLALKIKAVLESDPQSDDVKAQNAQTSELTFDINQFR